MNPIALDTIAAIATPRGNGGVAIVRVSGDRAVAVVGALVSRTTDLAAVPSHTVHHAWLRDAEGRPLDESLVTVMRAPRTFTGEDVVEIGVHGGSVVAQRVLEAVLAAGARMADRGEFTKRAFVNGRIDLSQAEAVSDLVAARTTRAADQALAALAGRLAERTRHVEETLLDLLARLELNLDFHEDVQAVGREAVAAGLRGAIAELGQLGERAAWGKRLRDGAVVVLTGEANVGKSSLFNALLEDDRALVSGTPGTTRDYLEAWIDIDGVPVRLVDTAGLREASSEVEAEGVRRARKLREEADLRLHVIDASAGGRGAAASGEEPEAAAGTLVVGNKSDLLGGAAPGGTGGGATVAAGVDALVSARTGDGIASLRRRLGDVLAAAGARWEAGEAMPGERHAEAIRRALRSLERAVDSWGDGATEEWIAGEVRDAAEALGEITGRTVSEEVLDRIFSCFCIGK
jgi:tRNA modification GTPase